MPFEHNLWVFMSFLRLTVVSISIQFSFYSVRTLPFPKKQRTHNRTSSPSHFSLLIGAASIKKRTCSTFLSSFIFLSSHYRIFYALLWIWYLCAMLLSHRKFYDFFVVILVNGFLCFSKLEMHFPFFCKMDALSHSPWNSFWDIVHWATLNEINLSTK